MIYKLYYICIQHILHPLLILMPIFHQQKVDKHRTNVLVIPIGVIDTYCAIRIISYDIKYWLKTL